MPGRNPRLYINAPLAAGAEIECEPSQANYLINVLRSKTGDRVLLFNGHDGEWSAEIVSARRHGCKLQANMQTRSQTKAQDIHYLFAPLKHARLDYMVQKATELGVSALRPIITAHTMTERINLSRMRANTIEAAEQCGLLCLPSVEEPAKLENVILGWPEERSLIFADESAPLSSPLAALSDVPPGPLAVLVGPEGGFSEDEKRFLRRQPFVHALSLGPRIMRADTAAVAVLALVNAVLGDWAWRLDYTRPV
jgi:16S rRNA (uracil1498-N3)-methyltransferase